MQLGGTAKSSIRHAIFVGVLAGSMITSSGAFAAVEITNQADLEAISITPDSLAEDYILMNDIEVTSPTSGKTFYVQGEFNGTFNGNFKTISGLTKPLFESISSASDSDLAKVNNLILVTDIAGVEGNGTLSASANFNSKIENIGVSGKIIGGLNDLVGGLIGESSATISNSYASVEVEGKSWIGGLIGKMNGGALSNSYSTGTVTTPTETPDSQNIGGLVGGQIGGSIQKSYATGDVTVTYGGSYGVGGLVGSMSSGAVVENSYATGDVNAGWRYIGGLVGENRSSTISNSFASGNVTGSTGVGGLVGRVAGASNFGIPDEYATVETSGASGNVYLRSDLTVEHIGALVGNLDFAIISNSFGTGQTLNMDNLAAGGLFGKIIAGENRNLNLTGNSTSGSLPNILDIVGSEFSVNTCINRGNIFLIDLTSTYRNSCTGDEIRPTATVRIRISEENLEVVATQTVQSVLGAERWAYLEPLAKNASTELIVKDNFYNLTVKAVEIAPTANVKVVAKAGEALQISLKSESKEPVELWVKSPDGSWLLAGVITFDENGKAILPPLQFKNAGDYSLVLSKPSADSAKGSAPLNQTGSLLVAVS
jgi:hypothetical protein